MEEKQVERLENSENKDSTQNLQNDGARHAQESAFRLVDAEVFDIEKKEEPVSEKKSFKEAVLDRYNQMVALCVLFFILSLLPIHRYILMVSNVLSAVSGGLSFVWIRNSISLRKREYKIVVTIVLLLDLYMLYYQLFIL